MRNLLRESSSEWQIDALLFTRYVIRAESGRREGSSTVHFLPQDVVLGVLKLVFAVQNPVFSGVGESDKSSVRQSVGSYDAKVQNLRTSDRNQGLNNFFWMSQLEGSPIVFLYGIVCTFGALANLVVLFAFIRTSNLRNLRNSFIVNLACSDLLLCVVTAPVTLYTSANVFWPFGNISCKVASSSNSTNRVLLYRVDSVDSDRSTVFADSKIKKGRFFRAMGRCAHACYGTLDESVPFGGKFEHLAVCGRSHPEICVEMQDSWDRAYISKTTFTITVLAIQYLLPLFALAYAYVQIGSTIRRRSKVSRTIDQARRISMQSRNSRTSTIGVQ
ncbi:hypothetical protein ANCCEY_00483 [Ancylostoma ceylanicum]|uniref:G-protein coupled receptors family 1 profile domain-containing protein n=1 Tax=Ancylostoma ceylanicum TaxID=53326 RepID=A0A0D6MBI8_9BILA|nr:hypothetical protein ANCCEY_00483 [Ancylostoma ceylanicum]